MLKHRSYQTQEAAMRFLRRALAWSLLIGLLAGAIVRANTVVATNVGVPQAVHVISFPVNGFQYSPNDITILAGDEVEWSGPFDSHPLVSDDNLWPVVNTGDSFPFTFTQPGVYRYHCQIHGAPGGVGMSGVVRVVAPIRTYLPYISR
jgi:plastocyanin